MIQNNLKLFDFNLQSGAHGFHPLHFAVQSNNIKAIEKFKKYQYQENINFFARDSDTLDYPQELAAPSAPVYKIMTKL